MNDRIIVSYDGSDLAREAFAYAVMFAMSSGHRILALHSIEPGPPPGMLVDPLLGFDPGPTINADEHRIRAEKERITREFAELEAECRQRSIPFAHSLTRGTLIEQLTDEAFPTDLIAVGRKGRFASAGFGSTTTALIHRSPCPVMVVSGPIRPLIRILAVYDNSPQSKRALAWAREHARTTGWPLTVLACQGNDHSLDHAMDSAERYCPDALIISMSREEQNDEGKLIEHAVEKAGYSLIVLGAYPESWWHRILFGGTTEHVIANVAAPIVLVH
ncbi:MAG: universal stress protein [Phycisphaerales bacterium JB043]